MGLYDEKGVSANDREQAEQSLPFINHICDEIKGSFQMELDKLPFDDHAAVQLCRMSMAMADTLKQYVAQYAHSGTKAVKDTVKSEVRTKARKRTSNS